MVKHLVDDENPNLSIICKSTRWDFFASISYGTSSKWSEIQRLYARVGSRLLCNWWHKQSSRHCENENWKNWDDHEVFRCHLESGKRIWDHFERKTTEANQSLVWNQKTRWNHQCWKWRSAEANLGATQKSVTYTINPLRKNVAASGVALGNIIDMDWAT